MGLCLSQDSSLLMTRPSLVRRSSKCHGSDRLGSEGVQNLTSRAGSGQEISHDGVGVVRKCSKYIRSGQVRMGSNLTGLVGSDLKFSNSGEVESGLDP